MPEEDKSKPPGRQEIENLDARVHNLGEEAIEHYETGGAEGPPTTPPTLATRDVAETIDYESLGLNDQKPKAA